jgi:hypothetical protein
MTMGSEIVVNGMVAVVSSLLSSLMVGLFMFWLEERRELRDRRREDYREAINWDHSDDKYSLRNYDLTKANLSGHKFVEADLESALLARSKIWGGDFSNANLRLVSFRKAELVGTKFIKAIMIRAEFGNATIRRREDPDFTYVPDFSEACLRRAIFRKAHLEGVVFRNANLTSGDFTNARIIDCDFTGADLTDSSWQRVREASGCIWKEVKVGSALDFPEGIWQEIQEQKSTP